MSDLHHMTVLDILPAYASGELSPVTLVEHLLERMHRLDAEINCLVDTLDDSALAAAQAAAQVYSDGGDPERPLLGVPFLLKEQHDLKGHSATRGSATRAGMIAEANHPIVQRLLDAGAIPIGRTTTPEFSCATFTQTVEWGVSRNPFNTAKTPGGSSGGSGGAVAAGFAPFATASDIAGSTRIPAAFNGLPGFKTPRGYTPGIHPLNADWYRGDHILARTVADTAFLTNFITGIHPQDHDTVPPEVFDYDFLRKSAAEVPAAAGAGTGGSGAGQDSAAGGSAAPSAAQQTCPAVEKVAGLRVALSPDLGLYQLDPAVADGVERVAAALEKAGAIVETVDLKLDKKAVFDGSMAHFGHLLAANLRLAAKGDPSVLEPYAAKFLELSDEITGEISLLESLALEQRVQDSLAAAMAGYDVLLTATSAIEDLDAGNLYLDKVEREAGDLEFYWHGHMTVPFNIANRCPVMSVPSGLGSAGVPVGVQVVGHPYQSEPVFAVSAAIEELLPFPIAPQMGQ